MSKLSAQCDELRQMAESVGLEVPQAATLMMGAADTIDRLDVENAKLREQGARLFDKTLELGTENAKLRKLVQDFDKCLTEAVRLAYIQGHATIYDGTLLDSLHPRMRELGIEVN